MDDQLVMAVWFLFVALCLHCVRCASTDFAEENFTYSTSDILASFRASSVLQCSNQCRVTACCLAVEYRGSTSTCYILQSARGASSVSQWEQYMVRNRTLHSGSYYLLTECVANWGTCSHICSAYGGHLATLPTSDEATFAQQYGSVWIGGTKVSSSWTWLNGEVFGITHWNPTQPDNSANKCIGSNVDGWYDHDCESVKLQCLCEI